MFGFEQPNTGKMYRYLITTLKKGVMYESQLPPFLSFLPPLVDYWHIFLEGLQLYYCIQSIIPNNYIVYIKLLPLIRPLLPVLATWVGWGI